MTSSRSLSAGDNPAQGETPARVFLIRGSLYCDAGPAIVSTVLGSCVAVCLSDRHCRASGMNHFVLPRSPTGEQSLRYGDAAMARLGEGMLRLGCSLGDLRAKVFGGAAVLAVGEANGTVGAQNVDIALEWLRRHAIPVVARRTGGTQGLLIRLHAPSGRVFVRDVTAASEC